MIIIHKNDISAYLSDWVLKINMLRQNTSLKLPKESKAVMKPSRKVFNALHIQNCDVNTILALLGQRLDNVTQNWNSIQPITPDSFRNFDHQSYSEARIFLKAFFIFFRIYCSSLNGVIKHFYPSLKNKRNFERFLKEESMDDFTRDLKQMYEPVMEWFPQVKETRDELVHCYEDFLIYPGKKPAYGSSTKIENVRAVIHGGIREALGKILCDCQVFIDSLLDHFDNQFLPWYGIVQNSDSRNNTHYAGDAG